MCELIVRDSGAHSRALLDWRSGVNIDYCSEMWRQVAL